MRFFRRASVVGADQTVLRFEAKRVERDGVEGGDRLPRLVSRHLGFYLADARQRRVPPRLQFARHQPVGGVGGIILAEGAVGGIARRFEIAAKRLAHLVAPLRGLLLRRRRRGNSAGTDHAQQGLLDRVVGAQSAKGDAARFAIVQPASAAAVAGNGVLRAGVAKRQLASAAMATEQPREERVAMFGRAMMPAGGDIAADHGADRFEPLPAHVAVMGVRHQRQPIRPRLAANLHAASSAISRRDSRSTIGIGAAINGVLDHPVDGRVGRSPPGHIPIRLLHRQIEIMLMEPKQRLARAAQLRDLVEDERDGLLHPPVRILLVTVAVLHEADGRGDDQFPTARLLISGRQRALAEKIKLVLVEAPLEPEEESVVPVPGRIHRLLINQHCVDHAAHLDELLPIPAVARKARDFAGAHGADLAEADLRNHPLEARALHAAGGGATEILVDDLNLRPAEPVRRSRMAYCKALLSRLCKT